MIAFKPHKCICSQANEVKSLYTYFLKTIHGFAFLLTSFIFRDMLPQLEDYCSTLLLVFYEENSFAGCVLFVYVLCIGIKICWYTRFTWTVFCRRPHARAPCLRSPALSLPRLNLRILRNWQLLPVDWSWHRR